MTTHRQQQAYGALLQAAREQLDLGTEPARLRQAADALRAVAPDHPFLRLLDLRCRSLTTAATAAGKTLSPK
jgi:hypothetical protein